VKSVRISDKVFCITEQKLTTSFLADGAQETVDIIFSHQLIIEKWHEIKRIG